MDLEKKSEAEILAIADPIMDKSDGGINSYRPCPPCAGLY